MGSLFRSEKMELIQMILNSEASYLCIAELGELGVLQFRDLNTNVNSFEKKFTRDVRRCEEMERQVRFINSELSAAKISSWDTASTGDIPCAPIPKDMAQLEEDLHSVETEIKEVNKNYEALKANFAQVAEVKHVLRKTQSFFDEMQQARGGSTSFYNSQSSQSNRTENSNMMGMGSNIAGPEALSTSAKLNFTAGTIPRNRVNFFEKILWRACHGNAFLKMYDINDETLTDKNGDLIEKSVFIVFYQGSALEAKVKKIAEGIRATVYPIPEEGNERRDIQMKIMNQIEDAQAVIQQTEAHRNKLLMSCARQVRNWHIKIMKSKSIYHIHNMLTSGNGSTLIGEAWCPTTELEHVKGALRLGTEKSGSTIPNIMEVMKSRRTPPTYNKLNKFTAGYQGLIDSYGVCSYQEVNPTPFTIITFPFLFGVMFGDIGHGLIMTLIAVWMILKEKQLAKANYGEIFEMMFGGRYIIILMGIFSTYCGFIYNDMFSKSLNIFGSGWRVPESIVVPKGDTPTNLNPNDTEIFVAPYFYGVDPIWQLSYNKILWSNSFKMKASVVFGIFQMIFGLLLKYKNCQYFQNKLNVVAEWIPEMIFLNSIFLYLVLTILAKWLFWPTKDADCAPSLLINLIDMFMFNSPVPCVGKNMKGTPTYLYYGQPVVQKILIFAALISVPWLLCFKPYVLYQRNKKRLARSTGNFGGVRVNLDVGGSDRAAIIDHDELDEVDSQTEITYHDEQPSIEQEEAFNLQEVVIYQIIHTIEFCLSAISHTASYLRLWALSLAHAQLSEVLWNMLLSFALKVNGSTGIIIKWAVFMMFGCLTVGILICMEGLSAFLHALRLHWVEFNSKFFKGEGHAFMPFSFGAILEAPENSL